MTNSAVSPVQFNCRFRGNCHPVQFKLAPVAPTVGMAQEDIQSGKQGRQCSLTAIRVTRERDGISTDNGATLGWSVVMTRPGLVNAI
ncbi:MAG: hypothetical protein J07HX5_01574 [halophilic archaeon J07HX5]|nr:MAG: hypothetical protein J07HX5_01574 [halophilic archaeon J07HX5]